MRLIDPLHAERPAPELTYEPPGVVPATMHVQREHAPEGGPFPGRVECPTCGVLRPPGAVVLHRPPHWSARFECLVGHRSTYCDGCRHVIHWLEQFIGNPDGGVARPTGLVLSGPGFYSGDDYLRRYLSAHPQAQEVEQA